MQQRKLLHKTPLEYWEERANHVLSHFNYQEPDEIDIYEICYRYGIKVKHHNKDTTFSVPKEGRRGIIYLQSNLPADEERVVLAEEFCHLYAHAIDQLSASEYFVGKQENQAKRMAAYLLMPSWFMENVYKMAEFNEIGVLIEEIADYFVVPEEFAHYRLQLDASREMGQTLRRWRGEYGSIEWME